MSKWNVCIPLDGSYTIKVETETEDEAIDKALEIANPSLCQHCAKHIDIDFGPCDLTSAVELP
jgi:hypothetical protein